MYRFYGKVEGTRPPRRPRYIWKDIIKIDVKEVECAERDMFDLGQEQLVDTCECVDKPLLAILGMLNEFMLFKKDCAVLIWSPTAVKQDWQPFGRRLCICLVICKSQLFIREVASVDDLNTATDASKRRKPLSASFIAV